MASTEISDIFSSFGCFDDTNVPSLFEDLESLGHIVPNPASSPASGSSSPEYEMMSVGSPSTSDSSGSDHSYHARNSTEQNLENNPVLTGAVSPEHEWSASPSPVGSLTSDQEESSDLLLYLMNESGVKITEKVASESANEKLVTDSVTTMQQQQPTVSQTSKSRKRHLSEESDEIIEKNRKNAIAARENRQKKKRYIEGLEKENKALSTENDKLTKDNDEMKNRMSSLEAEVDYLKSVLFNQSALSGLLKKLGSSEVRLSASFSSRKQPAHKQCIKPTSGGVCLHVNGKDASLEFCAQCGLMAESAAQ